MKYFLCALFAGLILVAFLQEGPQPAVASPGALPETSEAVTTAKTNSTPKPLQGFMRMKLKASNHILEGLVVDDMKMIDMGASMLLEMSVEEHWRTSNDMLYRQHSRTFRDSVATLKKKAAAHSTDGAALAWIDVTLNCIRCHDWVRNVMVADLSNEAQPVRPERSHP